MPLGRIVLLDFGILFSSHRAKASEGLYQACEVGFAPTLEYCAEEKVLYIYHSALLHLAYQHVCISWLQQGTLYA